MTTGLSKKQTHFLVVDDDNATLDVLVEYLKALGFSKITQASNGAQAVRKLEADPSINFIISDWDMPMMNGLSLLQRVRSIPRTAEIPFLIVTTPISEETEKIMLAAENLVNGYVVKPFRSATLQGKIDQVLASQRAGDAGSVILADDDPDARQMVKEYLESFGFKNVITFDGGKSALKHIQEHPEEIDLIIADWEMPEITGIELLKTCKADEVLSKIPFLIITSQGSMERMKVIQAAKANVDQYLLKPFGSDEIKTRVEVLIEKARNRDEIQKRLTTAAEAYEYGRYESARTAYEKVLELDPGHDMALRGLGDTLTKIKGTDAALPYYKKAVENGPYNLRNYLKLAEAYDAVGLYDKGVALLETARPYISFSSELHFRLAELLYKKQDFVKAMIELETTLQLDPDHTEARLMLDKLRRE